MIDAVMERLAEAVHKAYCLRYKQVHGKEYWTKGDYSLLDEAAKEYDRVTVRTVFLANDSENNLAPNGRNMRKEKTIVRWNSPEPQENRE